MAVQRIKVCPLELLAAAESAATTTQRATVLHPATVPVASPGLPGSPADGACAVIAAGIASQYAVMAADTACDGPRLVTTTQRGVAELENQDERNAQELQAVSSQQEQEQWL
jgi:hypothetical protein